MINIIWISLAIIALFSSIIVISAQNPVNRLCMLIIVYQAGSFMYTIMDFYFLGLTYIIVYVGAIAIQFQFVIMMIPVDHRFQIGRSNVLLNLQIAFLISIMIIMSFNYSFDGLVTFFYPYWSTAFITQTDIYTLGYTIYMVYPLALIQIGLSQFVTMIGIIAVTSK